MLSAKLRASFCPLISEKLPRLLGALDLVNRERIHRLNRDVDRWESAIATKLVLYAAACSYSKRDSILEPENLEDTNSLKLKSSSFGNRLLNDGIEWRREVGAKPKAVLISGVSKELAAQISVSHDEGFVVCASGDARGPKLGVDAISMKRAKLVCSNLQSLQAAARRFPTPIALKLFDFHSSIDDSSFGGGTIVGAKNGGPSPEMTRLFCVSWTLLEALAKAREVSVFSSDLKSMIMSGAAAEKLLEWTMESSTSKSEETIIISDNPTSKRSLQSAISKEDSYPLILIDAESLIDDHDKDGSRQPHLNPDSVANTIVPVEQLVLAKKVATLCGDGWKSETIEYDNQIITVVESS